MQLSKFFTLEEMTRSDTATRLGISNQPDDTATANLRALCDTVLDPLRAFIKSSITVSSGYRGPELNAQIGGATKSQHQEGKAADIQSAHMSVLDLFKSVIEQKLPYDQVIFEAKNANTKWVHVSHDPARARGEILVAHFSDDGRKVTYRAISVQEALAMPDPMPAAATRGGAMPELRFEELADEPDFEAEADEPMGAPDRKAAPKRKAASRSEPKKKKTRRRTAIKRKAAPKRKSALKRARKKVKKHK
jgi:hypothetical protein